MNSSQLVSNQNNTANEPTFFETYEILLKENEILRNQVTNLT